MRKIIFILPFFLLLGIIVLPTIEEGHAQERSAVKSSAKTDSLLAGEGVAGNWTSDAPGVLHHLTTADLPKPYATTSVDSGPRLVSRPARAQLRVPAGFKVEEFLTGLDNPRLIRTAPNGDIFVAESRPGRVRVLRAEDGVDHPEIDQIFVSDLDRPFGIGFYPPGPGPAVHLHL